MQDGSNTKALTMELLQYWAKLSMYSSYMGVISYPNPKLCFGLADRCSLSNSIIPFRK